MKIIIINGSHRKNGSTALILNGLSEELKKRDDVDVQIVNVADLSLNYCIGGSKCYKTGKCIHKDDLEALSATISTADGIIFGSPTYASNVSAQMKTIIDRGHFVMEQLLSGKYVINVATYENYGGTDTAKILNRITSYSGANITGTLVYRKIYINNSDKKEKLNKHIQKTANKLYRDIKTKHRYTFQSIKHLIIFNIGIKPFVIKNKTEYSGVLNYWKSKNII